MTVLDVRPESPSFGTGSGEWLDSVSKDVTETVPFQRFRTWVTGLVYGVEAPTQATFTRFPGQESQVAFADSIPAQPMDESRRSPLSQ